MASLINGSLSDATHPPAKDTGGIYLHVPFCLKKCEYCDFFSISDLSRIPDFVQAALLEIHLISSPFSFDSLYFGGGTPSLLPLEGLDTIIGALFKSFNISKNPEITLEANPKTIFPSTLTGYRAAGINRIQLGVQSFRDDHLAFLGRLHSSLEAKTGLHEIRKAGFDNLGLDLIYGLPGQSAEDWIQDMKEALVFEPEHLSCYLLTYESGTPLEKNLRSGKFQALSEESSANLFEVTREFLQSNGYFQYEISNFAKIEQNQKAVDPTLTHRSRHNQKYWRFDPYLGLGPSAHSYAPPMRSWNVRNLDQYLETLAKGLLPVEGQEVLTQTQEMTEAVALGLRTAEGVDISWFNHKFKVSFHDLFKAPLEALVQNSLVLLTPNHLRLSPKGLVLHNSITELLIQCF